MRRLFFALPAQPFFELYFVPMREIPDLGAILMLGEQVVVQGKRVTIELHSVGATRLGDAELQSVSATGNT